MNALMSSSSLPWPGPAATSRISACSTWVAPTTQFFRLGGAASQQETDASRADRTKFIRICSLLMRVVRGPRPGRMPALARGKMAPPLQKTAPNVPE